RRMPGWAASKPSLITRVKSGRGGQPHTTTPSRWAAARTAAQSFGWAPPGWAGAAAGAGDPDPPATPSTPAIGGRAPRRTACAAIPPMAAALKRPPRPSRRFPCGRPPPQLSFGPIELAAGRRLEERSQRPRQHGLVEDDLARRDLPLAVYPAQA